MMPLTYRYDTPIRYVRGLGPVKTAELAKANITTVGELLEKQPLSYIYPGGVSIADASDGNVVIKAKITRIFRAGHGAIAILSDDTETCKAQWFHNPWVLSSLHPGVTVTFWGKYKGGVLQQPKWTTTESTMENVYGGQYGVHHTTVRAALKEVLVHVELPRMNDGGWRTDAFQSFHFPESKEELDAVVEYLKQDEALQLQLALAERRRGREQATEEPWDWNGGLANEITDHFSYTFTRDQLDAKNDIIADMCCCSPMQRLIHGEVGSGKTAVAFYAAMLAALNGKRTLILCPTTILASQHYDTLKGMGWDDCQLWLSMGKSQGNVGANITIGTHALLHNDTLPAAASLVIIDEFQKFGVEQRAKLQKNNPHLLLLSATPIPRTLAATVFGDLDVSVIRELPIKRGTVITKWILPEKGKWLAMCDIIRKELSKGKQAYFVYPRIGDEEQEQSARSGYRIISGEFQGFNVGFLIGSMRTDEKARVLREFYAGDGHTQILVSTIIAEVGLDNPNATVMVVEGADRFGLSQLHQLRGRVCRSTDTAFCFLVSGTANPTSIARLEAIEKTNDGFEIAEEDLRLRGPGEVFSTRQSGLPDLKWISLVDDYDLMIEAKELVASGSVGSGVKEMMQMRYDIELGEVT